MDQIAITIGLLGGLALFLFGLDILTGSLKMVAGSSMRTLLEKTTRNRFTGLAAGAAVTALIQSSSVTTVLIVGFISAGLMTTAQSVAVIFGANIGTTITAQILAFKVTSVALPLLTIGFFTSFIARSDLARECGRIVLGLGLVFFGMTLMGDAMRPLREDEMFLGLMRSLDSVILAALIGAAFTALVQSSSATTGILIVMAGQGIIGLEPAIALAMGANVGTCVTAFLAALGKPRPAVRAALVHTLFNVLGVTIWIGFIGPLSDLARLVGPDGGGDIARQLANVHTLFNVLNALLFIGFTTQIARLTEWLLPDRAGPESAALARHLDPQLLAVPDIALDAARREVVHLGELTRDLVAASVPTVLTGSQLEIDRLRVGDRPIDLLHREIVAYLRQLASANLRDRQSGRLMLLIGIANDLEHMGDLVATGMVTSARKRIDDEVVVTRTTAEVIAGLHARILAAIDSALAALAAEDTVQAQEVRAMKEPVLDLLDGISAHIVARLRSNDPRRLHTYAREMEITGILDDIFRITRRIARSEQLLFGPPKVPDGTAPVAAASDPNPAP